MIPLLSALSILSTAKGFLKDRKNGGEKESMTKQPMTASGKLRLVLIVPLILTGITVILSWLCIFAGHRPGMMDDYAVFSLNTSRIGENVLAELNGAIKSADLKFDKRSEPVAAPVAMITPAPTTMLTVVARDLFSDLDSLKDQGSSKADAAASNLQSKATSVKSDVASKASSAESAAKSAANSAIGSVQDKVVKLVNDGFHSAVEKMNLNDIYNIHISTSCVGTYVYNDGKNYTPGDTKNLDQLKPRIDSCEGHDVVNPFQLVRIIYYIGAIATAFAFGMGVFGIMKPTRKISSFNIWSTLAAVIFMGLASAVTHGIAVGAKHLVGFVGDKIGVTGTLGSKFITLSWATTIMLFINMCFWIFVKWRVGRMEKNSGSSDRKRPDRTSVIAMNQWAPEISRPQPAHTDRNGQAMF